MTSGFFFVMNFYLKETHGEWRGVDPAVCSANRKVLCPRPCVFSKTLGGDER